MRIAVWFTGHEIADTVAWAARDGLIAAGHDVGYYSTDNLAPVGQYDACVAYGILRGTADVFRECDRLGKPWFHIDRGYLGPGHYDGYYRVSLCGTQRTRDVAGSANGRPHDFESCNDGSNPSPAASVLMGPWRGVDYGKPILVCPPTDAVAGFFGFGAHDWLKWAIYGDPQDYVIRRKGEDGPVDFARYRYLLTFNSSMGWKALAAGIPCMSDPTHSIVGAAYRNISLEALGEAQYLDRERLFGVMARSQLTLNEMRQGQLWPLMSMLLGEKHERDHNYGGFSRVKAHQGKN